MEALRQEVAALRAEVKQEGQATRSAITDAATMGQDYMFQVANNLQENVTSVLRAVQQLPVGHPGPQPDPALLRAMPHLAKFAAAYLGQAAQNGGQ